MEYSEFRKANASANTDNFNNKLNTLFLGYRHQIHYPKSIVAMRKFENEYPLQKREYSTRAINQVISSPQGNIPIRIYSPSQPHAVLLHFPPGEFCLGKPAHYDQYLSSLSDATQIAILSCETKMAPNNIYPAAHLDAVNAAKWLINNVKKEFNCEQLLIGGESSGANLALHALIQTLPEKSPSQFSGYFAVNGLFDCSQDRNLTHPNHHIDLNGNRLQMFLNAYTPMYSDRLSSPLSPLLHSLPLERLCPALFLTGTLSLLTEETIFLYHKWLISQNKAASHIFPGGAHNFIHYDFPLALEAQSSLCSFLSKQSRPLSLKKAI
ncbi:MAG TPA: alpha/beta hydrolase [Gammaproteobacteria bacterium]|nr:alpha/beta hydrolase [Gammaproteobacteria bacterium]